MKTADKKVVKVEAPVKTREEKLEELLEDAMTLGIIGFIEKSYGCYHLVVIDGHKRELIGYRKYMYYQKHEAIRRFREVFGLKYKKILWIDTTNGNNRKIKKAA